LNDHGINNVRKTKKHASELLVPAPHPSEVEIAIEKLKRHKLQHMDQILTELIQVGDETSCSEVHTLI
jgi:hypothetical protein